MTIIQIGCSQKGLANWIQQIVTGGIIVAAVALDRVRLRPPEPDLENRIDEDSRPRDPRSALSRPRVRTTAPMPCTPTRITRRLTSFSRPTAASRDTASRSRSVAATRSASRRSAPSVRSSSADARGDHRGSGWRSGDRWPPRSQLRWLGPEKGVIHISMAAIVNAVWDLHAKARAKAGVEAARRHDAAPDRQVHRLPLHHRRADAGRGAGDPRTAGVDEGGARGGAAAASAIPAYTTSAGWMGYSDEKIRRLVPRGARRRLDSLQGEGWRCPGRRRAQRLRSSARRSGRTAG